MESEHLKQEKQRIESRLFQILQTQKELKIEYKLLEKQLDKTAGKLEILESFNQPFVPEVVSPVVSTDTPLSPNFGVITSQSQPRIQTTECKITGQSFFEN